MNIPFIGQICVHYGTEVKKNADIKDAERKVKSIIKIKEKLGQIDKEEANKLLEDIAQNGILPEYRGTLYEYSSAIPLEYESGMIKAVQKKSGIKGTMPEDITQNDLIKILNMKINYKDKDGKIKEGKNINARELYYMGVRLGFPKDKLQLIERTIAIREKKEQSVKNNVRGAYSKNNINNSDLNNANKTIRTARREKGRKTDDKNRGNFR